MIFSSLTFLLVFLPVVLIAYYACPPRLLPARNAILLVASVFFYAWGEPKNVALILFCLLITYCLSFAVKRKSRLALTLSVMFNLAPLFLYKYADFLIENINLASPAKLPPIGLALPVGISFYTFQVLTYIIDLYRGRVSVARNPVSLALYIFLFPQLIAGPIVRYVDVEAQMRERRTTPEGVSYGRMRFIIGLSKKLIIANQAGLVVLALQRQESSNALLMWICVISYGVQILFDFSGYSDMAIGLGHLFGFTLTENFDRPYLSKSVTEFWRRWHISLSTFFRDYVYIPLGGNRLGKARQVLNLFVVWLLTGFWHGAFWNYAIWGLYYFILLTLEKNVYGKLLSRLPAYLSRLITFFFYMLGWAIFMRETNSLPNLLSYLAGLFSSGSAVGIRALGIQGSLIFVGVGLIISMCSPPARLSGLWQKQEGAGLWVREGVLLLLLVLCIFVIVGESFNPFIYFRF